MGLHNQAAKQSVAQVKDLHGTKGVGEPSGMTSKLATNLAADQASSDAALASAQNDPAASKLHAKAARAQGKLGHNTMATYHNEQAPVNDDDGD